MYGMNDPNPRRDLWQEFASENTSETHVTDSNEILKRIYASLESLGHNQSDLLGSAKYSIEESEHQEPLEEKLVEELIEESPRAIQQIVKVISKRKKTNDLMQVAPYMTNIHVLVGAPGVGKSTLAKAIALRCGLHYTFVSLQQLSNQYQHSGQSNLTNILGKLTQKKEARVIILDELQTIIKKRNRDDYDMEGAEALWKYLDTFKKKRNFLVIATANDLKILPEQVKTRIKGGVHTISLPDQQKREKIINYYLHLHNPSLAHLPTPNEITQLGKRTKNFTARDLEQMISKALSNAYDHSIENNPEGIAIINPQRNDFDSAISFIKLDEERFFPWYKKTYLSIKPHFGPAIQMLVPLTLQLGVNYIIHVEGMNQASMLHHSSLNQQAQFHEESVVLQKQGLSMQREGLDMQREGLNQQEISIMKQSSFLGKIYSINFAIN